jgi:spore germination cell wall hydrolase CwlJ-like protein
VTNQVQAKDKETSCLAKAIYFETYQQDNEKSRQAVAWVLLNRRNTDGWPATICENIYKTGQFPWVGLSIKDTNYYSISMETAIHMLNFGEVIDPTGGALYFASQTDWWFNSMIRRGEFIETHREGGHKFYFWKGKKK